MFISDLPGVVRVMGQLHAIQGNVCVKFRAYWFRLIPIMLMRGPLSMFLSQCAKGHELVDIFFPEESHGPTIYHQIAPPCSALVW